MAHTSTRKRTLAGAFPRVAREWHPTRNHPLTADEVGPGSTKRVWWRCPKDATHEWLAFVQNRTRAGQSCPYCSGRRATPETSLAALHPKLAREWHPTKNHPLTARDVRAASGKTIWWRCAKNRAHEWQIQVYARTLTQHGCPYCAGHRATPETSIAALRPKIAREWHPTKNKPLSPDAVTVHSGRKVWWRCAVDRGHEFEAVVGARTRPHERSGCPFCSGKRATPETSLAALHPKLAREWHPTKNLPLAADRVRPGSQQKVLWRCAFDHHHLWYATVCNRTRGRGCPHCYAEGRRRRGPKRRTRMKVPILVR